MPVMLQVRNLPDDVHAKLKRRAAEARMSLSDYVAQELARLVRHRRTNAEIFAAAQARVEEFGIPDVPIDEIMNAVHEEQEERATRWVKKLSSTPPPS